MKLTQWFHPTVKPVHIGWYHTSVANLDPVKHKGSESHFNWWWDGSNWLYPTYDKNLVASTQDRYWRGIAK
jgi:hypothetical protein